MSSLAFRLGFAVVGPIIGWTIGSYGLMPTLSLLACLCAALAFLSLWPLCKRINELRVDYIPESIGSSPEPPVQGSLTN